MQSQTTLAGSVADAAAVAPTPNHATAVQAGSQAWPTIAIVVAAMAAGALYTLAVGEDANWDWQNYHDYNVWALINGRYAIDVAPAGFQTYFNPLVYYPVYWLRHLLPAPIGLVIIGALHGLNLALIVWLTRVLLGRAVMAASAAVIVAAVGPMTLSETGTSFTDIVLSLPIILGFGLILTGDGVERRRVLLAGLLIGAAVGLKLTSIVFALGAVAAVLLGANPLTALLWLGIGGTIGSVATHGAWSVMLWRDLGNPIFPLFNGLFQAPELQPTNILDLQFMPRGLGDALAYPFYWLAGIYRSSEFPFRDARFAVIMLLIPIAIVVRIARGAAIFTRRDVQLFALFGVSYAAWLQLFAIQRYAVALELLCGPLIMLLIARLWPQSSRKALDTMMLLVAISIALWSQPGDWWRRPWSDPYHPAIPQALQQPAIFILLDKPMGYIAPLLAEGSRFYQLADIALPIRPDGLFDRRIRQGLAQPPSGGVWAVTSRGTPMRTNLLARYGLTIDASKPCEAIEGVVPNTAIEACPLAASTQ